MKNDVTKRDHLFYRFEPRCLQKASQFIPSTIRNAKREANLKTLGTNPFSRRKYRTFKHQTRSNQPLEMNADINKLNEYFTSIGPRLCKQVPKPQHNIDIPGFETTFSSDTSPDEIARIVKKEKSFGYNGISNETLK